MNFRNPVSRDRPPQQQQAIVEQQHALEETIGHEQTLDELELQLHDELATATMFDLLDDGRYSYRVENHLRAALDRDQHNPSLAASLLEVAQATRAHALTTQTIRLIHEGQAGTTEVLKPSSKLHELVSDLSAERRSSLGNMLTEEAAAVAGRHANSPSKTSEVDKLNRYLTLADTIAPPSLVDPAQLQARQAARIYGSVVSGKTVPRNEVEALSRQTQRLAHVKPVNSKIPLPEASVKAHRDLSQAIRTYSQVNNRNATAVAGIIDHLDKFTAVVHGETHAAHKAIEPIATLSTKPAGSHKAPRGSATDISIPSAQGQIVITSKGDGDAYSFWDSRGKGIVAAGVAGTLIGTLGLAGMNQAAAAPKPVNTADTSSRTATVPSLSTLAPAAAPRTTTALDSILTPLDIDKAQVPQVPELKTIGLNTPNQATQNTGTTPVSNIDTLPTLTPPSSATNPPVESTPPTTSQNTLTGAPTTTKTGVTPIESLPAVVPISEVPTIAPTPPKAVVAELKMPTAITPMPLQAPSPANTLTDTTASSQPESSTATTGTTTSTASGVQSMNQLPIATTVQTTLTPLTMGEQSSTYVTEVNTPSPAPSSQETLNTDLASGADVPTLANDIIAVIGDQYKASGQTLSPTATLPNLQASTLEIAQNINPTAAASKQQAAFAVALSQHPEILANPSIVSQIQQSLNTSNQTFSDAWNNWLNKQDNAPANLIGTEGVDNTDQVMLINQLLTSAQTSTLSDTQQQSWLEKNDLAAAVQNQTSNLASIAVLQTVTPPAATPPPTPKHAAPASPPPAKPAPAKPPVAKPAPAKANTAQDTNYTLNAEQINMIDGLNLDPAQKQFLKQIIPAVMSRIAKGDRMNPEAVIGQAILESGWASSSLAYQYGNLFGQKADSNWTGPTVTIMTTEDNPDGSTYRVPGVWEVYQTNGKADYGKAMDNYALRIGNAPQYQDAMACSQSPQAYLQALENKVDLKTCQVIGGDLKYATDVDYVSKVMNIVTSNNLTGIINAGRPVTISRYTPAPPTPKPAPKAAPAPKPNQAPQAKNSDSSKVITEAVKEAWTDGQHGASDPDPDYKDAQQYLLSNSPNFQQVYGGADCDNYVATVMRKSGVDGAFPAMGTWNAQDHMNQNPQMYKPIANQGAATKFDPNKAYIFVINKNGGYGANGHIWFKIPTQANGKDAAGASGGDQMPYEQKASWYLNNAGTSYDDGRGAYSIYEVE